MRQRTVLSVFIVKYGLRFNEIKQTFVFVDKRNIVCEQREIYLSAVERYLTYMGFEFSEYSSESCFSSLATSYHFRMFAERVSETADVFYQFRFEIVFVFMIRWDFVRRNDSYEA